MTHEYVVELMEAFKAQKSLHWKYVAQIVIRVINLARRLPSLIRCSLSSGQAAAAADADGNGTAVEPHFTICGDTHGQYYDLCNIFELNGYPSPSNPYLFNGDFVDRGSFSLENVLTLFCWKLLYPDSVHLLRGNHETVNMNKMYGFEGEVRACVRARAVCHPRQSHPPADGGSASNAFFSCLLAVLTKSQLHVQEWSCCSWWW